MNVMILLSYVIMNIFLTAAAAKASVDPIKLILIYKSDQNVDNDDARRNQELENERKERRKENLIKQQHQNKMWEISEFLKTHMLSTNYFYEEIKRIKEQRMIKGPLRRMVDWLEETNHQKERKAVYECYMKVRKASAINNVDMWREKVNNLVINVLKDPHNDGTRI